MRITVENEAIGERIRSRQSHYQTKKILENA